jgi:uncharacterized protein YggE
MTRFGLLFAILIAITLNLFSQEHPSVTAQPNSVYVSADGKFDAAPDTALIQFNIRAQAETSKAAYGHGIAPSRTDSASSRRQRR